MFDDGLLTLDPLDVLLATPALHARAHVVLEQNDAGGGTCPGMPESPVTSPGCSPRLRGPAMPAPRIDYVPESYRFVELANATLWTSTGCAASVALDPIRDLLPRSIDDVRMLVDFVPARRLHVVIYASASDARRALDRNVEPTFLLAPLHTETHALIALHSPEADARNGDLCRMHRHLCHEVAHVLNAERSGSRKRLGDGNAEMRIRPWVDEGISECAAAVVAARADIVQRALCVATQFEMSFDEADAVFTDLASPDRARAAALATSTVWRAVASHGFPFVHAHIDEPSRWLAVA